MKGKQIFFVVTVVFILINLSGCFRKEPPEPRLVLRKASFKKLPGWQDDDQRGAIKALRRSCVAIKKQGANSLFSKSIPKAGKVCDWKNICMALDDFEPRDKIDAQEFLEYWFEPYRVYNNSNPEGLFTGYYLPKLKCSLKPSKRYHVPIYALPDDWVRVNLGLFRKDLKGKSVIGRVINKRLQLYPDRKEIVRGAIKNKAKVLMWCDDHVDVVFAHIQGSAVAELPNKKQLLINYEGSNGRSYTSIGRFLVKNGALNLENSSMQDIRAWFSKNPKKVNAVLDKNASYVFFRVLENKDPLGSQQVPLVPGRSLAVDRRYIQLGIPVWLVTDVPNRFSKKKNDLIPFRRLLIAQDTGGAIKGVVRGDVYWGSGEDAAFVAGHMKNQGGYWVLLPRNKLN